MRSTEIIYQVTENITNIINQIDKNQTINNAIMEMSKQIDLQLEKLMAQIEVKN